MVIGGVCITVLGVPHETHGSRTQGRTSVLSESVMSDIAEVDGKLCGWFLLGKVVLVEHNVRPCLMSADVNMEAI